VRFQCLHTLLTAGDRQSLSSVQSKQLISPLTLIGWQRQGLQCAQPRCTPQCNHIPDREQRFQRRCNPQAAQRLAAGNPKNSHKSCCALNPPMTRTTSLSVLMQDLGHNTEMTAHAGSAIGLPEANSVSLPLEGVDFQRMAKRRFQSPNPFKEGNWWWINPRQDVVTKRGITRKRKRMKVAPGRYMCARGAQNRRRDASTDESRSGACRKCDAVQKLRGGCVPSHSLSASLLHNPNRVLVGSREVPPARVR
jgi:hypothetical protein